MIQYEGDKDTHPQTASSVVILFISMCDDLWSEIQDMQGEIFDIPDDIMEQIYEAEQDSDCGVGK